jgi:bifunctional non-homologous end joining protein LigD
MAEETIKTIQTGRRRVAVSHPDKLYFPDEKITKYAVVEYYAKVAGHMLPHTRGRPISMQRFPDGIDGENFYQKDVPDYFPHWVSRADVYVKKDNREQEQVVLNDAATLVYVAEQGTITPHTWLSRVDDLERPDKLVVDLDPSLPTGHSGDTPPDILKHVRTGASALREAFEEMGLVPYVMTTGSRGYHVVVPLKTEKKFDEVRSFVKIIAEQVAGKHEDILTTSQRKEKRGTRVFLDIARNAYGQTSVPPYTLRARKGAPIATPLAWDELGSTDPRRYTIRNIFRRLSQKEDPWKDICRHARALPR